MSAAPPHAVQPSPLPAAVLAACVPTLLAYHQPPSATLLNQCVAVALWGLLAAVLAPGRLPRCTWPLLAALGLLAAAATASWGWGRLPLSLALQGLGLLAGAALMVVAGAASAQAEGARGSGTFAALAWGLLCAGVLGSGVALVQVFAPAWADGDWIAHSGLAGRAVGNLRQPNHLCSLLLWALVAAVGLHQLGRLPRGLLWPLGLLLVFAVELTASRTGAAGLLLLLLWALIDCRLSRPARWLLLAAPLLYALSYAVMAWYGDLSQQALGAGARLAAEGGVGSGGDSPNSRLNIWRNALALIGAQPWAGVGFGEFNLAWSLSAFAHRPTAFFDHSHNLPLQLLVELGLPLGGLVLALLAIALWQAWRRAHAAQGDAGAAARAGLVLVLMAGLHSQVEYPLWYAYFLLPAALAWGLVLGMPGPDPANVQKERSMAEVAAVGAMDPGPTWGRRLGLCAGLLMALGGWAALLDYQRVVVIYAPRDGGSTLASRIALGQRSLFFAHHADYAAATNPVAAASQTLGFLRAPHSLLDTRLMVAWAQHLAATGRVDLARWLAQRLREFGNPESAEFFAPCQGGATQAYQCQLPVQTHDWRDFVAPAAVTRSAATQAAASPAAAAGYPPGAASARQ